LPGLDFVREYFDVSISIPEKESSGIMIRGNGYMLDIIQIVGIAAAVVSGVIAAKRNGMDLVGVCIVSFITALGGGTIRDMLLNRYPLFWIADPLYVIGVLGLAVVLAVLLSFTRIRLTDQTIIFPDALGLGLYAAVGTAFAMEMHVHWVIALMMGVITATFGGVMRDILCNKVPAVFMHGEQLYATCALGGSVVYLLVKSVTNDHVSAASAAVLTTTALRMLSVKYNIGLPF
jgi:uncharacterized membrane protein YeiH